MPRALADYIKVYDGTLPAARCEALIARFEDSSAQHQRKDSPGAYSFTQLDVSAHWPDADAEIGRTFLAGLARYRQSLGLAPYWPAAHGYEAIRLKRYLPDGRDGFPPHVDVMDITTSGRFITAILYLNTPGGGETVFPGLEIAVPPAPGRMIVFPPLWLYPHAGMPPRDRPKYILHSYLHYPPGAQNPSPYPV